MNILLVLVPVSLALVGFGVWAFLWAVGSGQFDDLESPGWDALRDEAPQPHQGSVRSAGSTRKAS